jgi:PH domain
MSARIRPGIAATGGGGSGRGQNILGGAGARSAAVVKSGWLNKQGGARGGRKNWKRRWFVLKEDCLYYYRDETVCSICLYVCICVCLYIFPNRMFFSPGSSAIYVLFLQSEVSCALCCFVIFVSFVCVCVCVCVRLFLVCGCLSLSSPLCLFVHRLLFSPPVFSLSISLSLSFDWLPADFHLVPLVRYIAGSDACQRCILSRLQ